MSQAAFALLHEGVQRAIYDLGWKQIRPVQAEAIHALLEGEGHVLISAATAGGKTEAAFLPVISRLAEAEHDSIRAIYVGPLKALINDQFGRLDRLCERMQIPVHRWHGDVTASHKQALRRDPGGILLITPESLESNFINYGNQVPRLYRGLEFVVIDELHSFLGNVRGVHLLSLLSRLRAATGRQPRMIGLSATLGDPEMGKCYLAPDAPATVTHIQDAATGRSIRFALKGVLKTPDPAKGGSGARRLTPASAREFIQKKSVEQLLAAGEPPRTETTAKVVTEPAPPDDLDDIAEDLIRHFATSTNLVFVNSRRTAEELAVRLHDRVTKLKWPHDPFMIHHGSVAKELREETETALKSGLPTTAICSSTLEMGIDIGSVRSVGQIDPPWSVASLVQRLGRSGRREGESSIMRLYVREESPHAGSRLTDLLFPDLLRGIALTRLMREKWLEPAEQQRMHLSTLVHQILSWLRQTGGMPVARLHAALVVDGPFRKINPADFAGLLRSLAAHQLIEQLPTGDLILAPAGERIAASKDFYSAFKGTEMFTVRHEKNAIGELPFDAVPPVGQIVIHAGRRWLVGEIDGGAKIVWVSPARSGGKVPVFVGSGGDLHIRIVQEMKAALLGDDEPPFLDEPALELLRTARHVAHTVGLDKTDVLPAPGGVRWFPWAGTRCLRTLALLAKANKVSAETDRLSLWLPVDGVEGFREFLKSLTVTKYDPIALGHLVTPRAVEKFDEFIPDELLDQAAATERLAVAEALAIIEQAGQRLSERSM